MGPYGGPRGGGGFLCARFLCVVVKFSVSFRIECVCAVESCCHPSKGDRVNFDPK